MKKAAVLMMLMFIAFVTQAQKPTIVTSDEQGWQKIGETTASFKMQNESIVVWGADKFTTLKLKVKDAPLHITRFQVFYENGEMEEKEINEKLDAGAETSEISLDGSDNDIQKVAFTYQTVPNFKGEKADVELHGYKKVDEDNREDKDRQSENYREDAEDAAERTEDDMEDAAERTENDLENTADRTEDDLENTGDDVEREAEEAERNAEQAAEEGGNEIKEGWNNMKANIKDQVYEGKTGPNGEKVYINNTATYYYINENGEKVSVEKSQLKDKKDNEDKDNNDYK